MSPLRRLVLDRRSLRAAAAGCVALAAGGVVLLRAPHPVSSAPVTPPVAVPAFPSAPFTAPHAAARGPALGLRAALASGAITARSPGHVYAVVDLDADRRAEAAARAALSLALVLDVSGSMGGEKIAQARNAVLDTVAAMRDDDRVALVTYSDAATMVQPLARVGDVRARLREIVPTINTIAGTNIPAGLAMGAVALGDGGADGVRRVVLLSDGRDGSGQALDQVAAGVRSRSEHGVTLSALGIGADYDEAYMSRVADAGRGNYEFMRDGAQLRTFVARELEAAEHTTVDQAVVEADLPDGWHLARAYGVEAETHGTHLRLPVGALTAGDHRRVVLDLVVDPARAADTDLGALALRATWRAMPDARAGAVALGALPLRVVSTEAEAVASRDASVFADAQSVVLAEREQQAVDAWRGGRVAEAADIARTNVVTLQALQAAAPSPARAAQIQRYESERANFNAMSAASEEGRAFGLGSIALHRRAMRSSSAY